MPLWNSKTARTTQLCLHPNDGMSLGICGSGYSSNINRNALQRLPSADGKRCNAFWWEPKGGGRRNARCAGSLQVGLLERKVHATTARQRPLQHWDFGTSGISFSSHIQTKGIQQRPPPKKSLKLASCQTKPVASLFWQRFCNYPTCIFLGGENVWGGGDFGGGGKTYG